MLDTTKCIKHDAWFLGIRYLVNNVYYAMTSILSDVRLVQKCVRHYRTKNMWSHLRGFKFTQPSMLITYSTKNWYV